jgi:hypothetical protein
MRKEGWNYVTDLWNYIDWANIIVSCSEVQLIFQFFLIVIALRIKSVVDISKMDVAPDPTTFSNFENAAFSFSQEANLNAFNGLLCWFKLFKFIHIFPRMKMLTGVVLSVRIFSHLSNCTVCEISASLFGAVLYYVLGIFICTLDFPWK